jgi:acetate kinase
MAALVLVLNAGSSSLKFSLFDSEHQNALLEGLAERLGSDSAQLQFKQAGKILMASAVPGMDHLGAISQVFAALAELQLKDGIIAIGHRVVHGGRFFNHPTLVTDEVEEKIRRCAPLAPLHMPANLLGIIAARKACPHLPQVVSFDTAFHQTMPARAYLYALPREYYERYDVRRYGFHGISHEYVSTEVAHRLGLAPDDHGIIVAHLGNGSSVCAVANGQSMDTSMGLTPLEGLVMGTRSGDLDAGILEYLHSILGLSFDELLEMLNTRSGLLGLSGISNDMRNLCELADKGNSHADTAIEVFCYRLAKYIAAYTVALPRVDAIAFTGGIGENARPIRARVTALLNNLGVNLSPELNQSNGDARGIISSAESRITLMVIPTREEWMIARETISTIASAGGSL